MKKPFSRDFYYYSCYCFTKVLFKLFLNVDDTLKKIEERADKLLKEMTDFADELV